MRGDIATGSIQFRKAHIQSIVDPDEVEDHTIHLIGDDGALEQTVAGWPPQRQEFAVV